MGRAEALNKAKQDYADFDNQIERTKAWIQRRFMGFGRTEEDEELRKDNPYLVWALGHYGDDYNLMFSDICNRESRGVAAGGNNPDRRRNLSGRGWSEGPVRYQIGALHYAFELPANLREHCT